jgi:hypothetical protein
MNRSMPQDDLLDLAIRESLGGRLASATAEASSRAWSSSESRRVMGVVTSNWRALSIVQRIRTGTLIGGVGMVVHRAMAVLGPAEPLGNVVPGLVLVACALIAALAEPIARGWERLRR